MSVTVKKRVNTIVFVVLRIATEDTILHSDLGQVYADTGVRSGRLSSQRCQ